jgi:histidinol-phosphate aminotransferase
MSRPEEGRECRPEPTTAAVSAYSIGPSPPANVRRLHLNEYRFPHAAAVIEALRSRHHAPTEDLLTQYQSGPDPGLVGELARYVGAHTAQNILVSPGSDEVLRAVLDTSRFRGHNTLLMGIPGYTHFEHYARLQGLSIVAYPIGLATSAEDHEASLRYHADLLLGGCLVYLCSPNNPTGDLWERRRVEALAEAYPKSLFLVDEAYVEFASAESALSGEGPFATQKVESWSEYATALNYKSLAQLALARDNIVVTRTFSKAFGLAALRIGYAVGTQATIASLAVAVSPKAFNPVAAPVACMTLRELGHYYNNALTARREARRVTAALRSKGWWVLDTPGNFYLVYAGSAGEYVRQLSALGVQVRDRDDLPGLAGFVRVTAGSEADSEAVLAAFAALRPPKGSVPQSLYTGKGTVAVVKVLMKKTASVLHRAAVGFWAQGGTMLGMFRHRTAHVDGGMIPWDNDGDLAYLRTDREDPLAQLVRAFAEEGLTLQRNRTDAYWQAGTNLPGEKISPVHIDIFSYRAYPAPASGGLLRYLLDDERFRFETPDSSQADCNTSYTHDELFPLDYSYKFYDHTIAMPAQSEKVLRRALGNNFMTEAKVRTPEGSLIVFTLRDRTAA